jgi:NAD(P)-dependent dehydrogenase (short-subunit alcohol dehydrogenase family)
MPKSRDFSGKFTLITGSSSDIGAATAISLLKAGAQVVVTDCNADNVSKVSQECEKVSPNGFKALEVMADLIKEEDCKRLIDSTICKFGKLDILVNNAGADVVTSIKDTSIMDSNEHFMKLNMRSVVYLIHLAIEYLDKTKGVIVNVSSIAGMKPLSIY